MGDATTGSMVVRGSETDEDGGEPATDDRFERAVLSLLETGPMPLCQLVAQLDERGELAFLREDGVEEKHLEWAVSDELMMLGEVWATTDDTVASLAQLTDTMVLTHRVGAEELEQGEVTITPDLVGLDYRAPQGLDLTTGGRLVYQLGPHEPGESHSSFAGPAGWLGNFEPGDLLAFRRSGTSVDIERIAVVAPGDEEVELLRGTIDGRIPDGGSEEATPLLLDALVRSTTAFRQPVRPLGELLGAAGLERRGFSFGRAGDQWESAGEQHQARENERLAHKWHFDTCCAAAFRSVREAFDAFTAQTQPGIEHGRQVAGALAHGPVGPAFAELVLGSRVGGDDHLAAFAGQLIDTVHGRPAAPAHLLRALEAERRGDATTAEDALRNALRVDPGYEPAATELVYYEVDRGEARRALDLFRRSDASPESELLTFLEGFLADIDAPYRGIGRNDRCPCGSGRKFKGCCLSSRPPVTLSQRIGLLSHKLVLFLGRDHRRPRLADVATSACDPDADDFLGRLLTLTDSAIVADLVAFEGGGARDYLDERGSLLPDDERHLLERLLDEPRRLWEVVGNTSDRCDVLRSVDDGEPCEVLARVNRKAQAVGDLVLARRLLLADDDAPSFFGLPLEVPPSLRDDALHLIASGADADSFAGLLGRMLTVKANAAAS